MQPRESLKSHPRLACVARAGCPSAGAPRDGWNLLCRDDDTLTLHWGRMRTRGCPFRVSVSSAFLPVSCQVPSYKCQRPRFSACGRRAAAGGVGACSPTACSPSWAVSATGRFAFRLWEPTLANLNKEGIYWHDVGKFTEPKTAEIQAPERAGLVRVVFRI